MRPIAFDWESGTATIEWLSPTVGLIRFMYPAPQALPFRGVCCIDIKGKEYEFKGMVFRATDDAPTLAEHRAIKGYLASMGLVGKSRRLKNGMIVTKMYPGNSAQTLNCGEMKMPEDKVQEGRLLVGVSLTAHNADGTVFAVHGHKFNMTEAQFAWLQDSLDGGTIADLKKLRDQKLAAVKVAA
jgi:hypothetical protein